MFYKKDKLIGLFPASINEKSLISHGGLTYGGIIQSKKGDVFKVLEFLSEIIKFCKKNAIKEIIYKAIPSFYHEFPSEEDLYALYVNDFSLLKREISTAIPIESFKLGGNKRRGHKKAYENGCSLKSSDNFELFFKMANERLDEKYNVKAVHNAEEMKLLSSSFPENIKMYICERENELLGGAIVYINKEVVHLQYLTTTELGRKHRSNDFVVVELLKIFSDKKWFDFGISTEHMGRTLNSSLIQQKSEFGGAGLVYDTYIKKLND